MHPFYTIGHSTRSIVEFMDLLRSVQVTLVADVRTVPRSRTNPQYNRENLPHTLRQLGADYEHISSLGGLRSATRDVLSSVNAFGKTRAFTTTPTTHWGATFTRVWNRLIELGAAQRCAIMCAEAVWWRCHRRIIADYLVAGGETVFHITGPGKITLAQLTVAARRSPEGLTYPAVQ